MTPKHEFEHEVKLNVEARVRQGVKAALEEVLQEEMTRHLEAGYQDLTPTRRGERNGHYTRNLLIPQARSSAWNYPVGELPGVQWQRCVVHCERNVLSHVPASDMSEVADDLKAVFKVREDG